MVQSTEMPAEQIGFAYSFTERLFLFSKGKDAEVFWSLQMIFQDYSSKAIEYYGRVIHDLASLWK